MASVETLRKRIDTMLLAVEQQQKQLKPDYGLILYEPLQQVEDQRLDQKAYHARIIEQQPEVRDQLASLHSQGVTVFVWLPKKDGSSEGYET